MQIYGGQVFLRGAAQPHPHPHCDLHKQNRPALSAATEQRRRARCLKDIKKEKKKHGCQPPASLDCLVSMPIAMKYDDEACGRVNMCAPAALCFAVLLRPTLFGA